jgi:L-threonylcarbamoyladenylate synthase
MTIVLPGRWDLLPRVLGGGSEFVGIRVPNHPLALQLIRETKGPIAAPSANLFGHVSPTSAAHVLDDFRDNPAVSILDGGDSLFGVESTVVKLEKGRVLVLREGAISLDMLREATGL